MGVKTDRRVAGARNKAAVAVTVVPISEGKAAADVSSDPNFPFAENSRRGGGGGRRRGRNSGERLLLIM